MVSPITVRATNASYSMAIDEEVERVALARRAGEVLDHQHRMVVGGSRSLAGQLGRLMEQRVFDVEWGGHDPAMMQREYGPYEDRSIHAVIVDDEGIVAAARSIWSPSPSLPTKIEADLGHGQGELRSHHRLLERYGSLAFSELATVAVRPDRRGGIATGWILGEMRYQQMCQRPGSPSCAMIAVPFYRMIRAWGHEIAPLGGTEPSDYLGVLSQPAFFEPGAQDQIEQSRLFGQFSEGWLSRARRPLRQPFVDVTAELSLVESPDEFVS